MINIKVTFKDAHGKELSGKVIQEYNIHNEQFVKVQLDDGRTFIKNKLEVKEQKT